MNTSIHRIHDMPCDARPPLLRSAGTISQNANMLGDLARRRTRRQRERRLKRKTHTRLRTPGARSNNESVYRHKTCAALLLLMSRAGMWQPHSRPAQGATRPASPISSRPHATSPFHQPRVFVAVVPLSHLCVPVADTAACASQAWPAARVLALRHLSVPPSYGSRRRCGRARARISVCARAARTADWRLVLLVSGQH